MTVSVSKLPYAVRALKTEVKTWYTTGNNRGVFMIHALWRFCRRYSQFSLALVAALIALPLDLGGQHVAAHWILGIAASVLVLPLLWGMWEDFRSGTYGIDIL